MFVWMKLIPLRDWAGAAALLGIFLGYVMWSAHERNIGEARCQAQIQVVTEQAKVQLDALRSPADPIVKEYNALNEALKNAKFTPIKPAATNLPCAVDDPASVLSVNDSRR